MPHTYTTKEIAEAVGIHVNTVRFYEKIGFLTKAERQQNGYRVFTDLQLGQCRLIRLAMRAEVLQNGLRDKAVEVVKRCTALDFIGSLNCAEEYLAMTEHEIRNAKAAVKTVESILGGERAPESTTLKRKEAAQALGVTSETLRTWERSGLIELKRAENGYRAYSAADMERLNIIKTLRLANYSLSAILRLLSKLDNNSEQSVEAILNMPDENEDIISVCDRLIISLKSTAADARKLCEAVRNIERSFSTPH